MSGDLEDFLRRAAQRRQAKAAQQQQQQQPQQRRQPPQYSDRRRERVVRAEPVDEVLTAEIVEENSIAARMRHLEESKQAAAQAEAEAKQKLAKVQKGRRSAAAAVAVSTGNPTFDLIQSLRTSNGIRQAILLREILDRPEHRW